MSGSPKPSSIAGISAKGNFPHETTAEHPINEQGRVGDPWRAGPRGIHLCWQIDDRLGLSSGGFDIYRREENLTPYTCCSQVTVAAGGSILLMPSTPGMTCTRADFSASGTASPAEACGSASGVFFSGSQTVTIEFGEPVRYVALTLDAATPPTPHADANWRAGLL
jgi:hypothetical protein